METKVSDAVPSPALTSHLILKTSCEAHVDMVDVDEKLGLMKVNSLLYSHSEYNDHR